MGSNTFPQQQSMGQMPQQMAPMQQQDQQTGFAGMYAPQYGSLAPASGSMQGYGGGQSVQNNIPQGSFALSMPQEQAAYINQAASNNTQQPVYGVMPQEQAQYINQAAANMAQQDNQAAPVAPQMYNQQVQQSVPNYQVPQVQQQPVAGYGGYAQQPMQNNPYGGGRTSSRQGPQRLY